MPSSVESDRDWLWREPCSEPEARGTDAGAEAPPHENLAGAESLPAASAATRAGALALGLDHHRDFGREAAEDLHGNLVGAE
jgi:hypothetical protein